MDYTPPLSPNIIWTFKGTTYAPPASPNIVWTFGAEDEDSTTDERKKSTYMLLLTM